MAKPYEQEVLLDADGKPLFAAMDVFEQRVKNIQKMLNQIQKDGLEAVKKVNTTIDANVKALKKAQGDMNTYSKLGETDRKVTRTLARNTAQADASKYGTTTARIGYELELEKRLQALRAAGTEQEKRAALEAVTTANARLRAIQQIEAAEGRVAKEIQAGSRNEALSGHRARLALSRQYGEQQAKNLGTEEAVRQQIDRQRQAEMALGNAKSHNRNELRQQLELENARLRAIERIAAAEAKANRGMANANAPGGPGGPPRGPEGRLGNILSPGYAAAAFARTSVYGAAAGAAYGAFNVATGSIGNVVELQDEMAKLQAISNSTDAQMVSLKGSIMEVGRSSRFSVVELTKISQTLAQAGVNATEMKSVLRSVIQLATASGSTPDEAVQLVTSALGSFQLAGSEAARVADLMTTALNRTKLTVQQTGQAIQYVGATAYEQNIGLEQLLATVGAVAQAGVRSGSTIGTGFRQFLVDLADPSKKLTEQLTLLGLKAADVDVQTKGLPQVLENLKKAGFGAGQAYAGLETRAAAFFLVVKNNTDLIDTLQLSFANSGAAALANERAMTSLSAQWQRFKNILSEGLDESLKNTMTLLTNLLERVSSSILRAREEAERLRNTNDDFGITGDRIDTKTVEDYMRRGLNAIGNKRFDSYGGLGNYLDSFTKSADGATASTQRMATQVAKTTEAADAQRGKIAELDKEMLRLITQKESLHGHDQRSAAEVATLTSRFQGLAVNLTGVGNRYDDLTQAMRRYRGEQLRLLGVELTAQNAALVGQSADARLNANSARTQLMNTPAMWNQLTAAERQAVQNRAAPNSPSGARALGVLGSAVGRFGDDNPANGQYSRQMVNLLNTLVQSGQTTATNTAITSANTALIGQATAQATAFGDQVAAALTKVNADIAKLGSLENGSREKRGVTNSAYGSLTTMERAIQGKLKLDLTPGSRAFLQSALEEIPGLRQQIRALNTATADETKAAKAEMREAEKGAKLTQQKMDQISQAFLGNAFIAGSGQRSRAEQQWLYDNKKTRATPDSSGHSQTGGIARDWKLGPGVTDEMAEQMAQGLRNHFKKLGLDVVVKYENGKGKYNGTGRHIHTNARPGTRFKEGGSGEGDVQAMLDTLQDQTEAAQINIDKRELDQAFKDLAAATDEAAQTVAMDRAQKAVAKVAAGMRTKAKNDLGKGGASPTSAVYSDRMAQVEQDIQLLMEEAQRRVMEAFSKSIAAMLKAAQLAYEKALAPSQRSLALANGAVSGLGYASLQGRVPDSTMALAQQQAARAAEAADRAKLNNLPGLIDSTTSARDQWQAKIDAGNLDTASLAVAQQRVEELTASLQGLESTQQSLAAAFGAGGLLPTTLTEGLDQAIQAYTQLHGLNRTFTEQVNGEMMGAIGTLHQGLEGMFSSILDGSATAGQAVLNFAKAMIAAVAQIVAKIIATKVIQLIMSLFPGGQGASVNANALAIGNAMPTGFTGGKAERLYNGGRAGPKGYQGGGRIQNGNTMRDSVLAMLAKGEWVINKRAADSLGDDFMADLNARGSKAVESTQGKMPSLSVNPRQEMNVWMVKPDEMPSMGPNDVLVTWQNDVLQGGQSRRLIETIARDAAQ